MKELEESTDKEFIIACLTERRSDCSNYYSPLYKHIGKLIDRIEKGEVKL